MKDLNIGQIGDKLKGLVKIDFKSKQAFYDYDLIFIDLNSLANIYNANYSYDNPKVRVDDYKCIEDFLRRTEDIHNFFVSGKNLIFSVPIKQEFYTYDNFQKRVEESVINVECLPIEVETIHTEGQQVEVIPNTKFTNFFLKYKEYFEYQAYLRFEGKPLVYIKDTTLPIAGYRDNLYFIPNFSSLPYEMHQDFIKELVQIILHKDDIDYNLPEWTNAYILPGEKEIKAKLDELNFAKQEIVNQIGQNELIKNKIEKQKVIFSGTGKSLEIEIKNLFIDLGFEILNSEESNHEDLIIKYNNKIAVLEIKGVSGSATQKQATQLEKWLNEFQLASELTAKGILIVNAFKDMEPKERNQPVFPDQMIKYSKNREHCLISGLQLLNLYYRCKRYPSEKEKLMDSLFTTNGIYNGFEKWEEWNEINNLEQVPFKKEGEEIIQ